MPESPSSRPPPLPPIRHCSACNAAVLDGEKRCSRCGYTTADPVPPFPLDERRRTPSGFLLPSLSWESPGDPVSDIQAALESWEGARKFPQTPDERRAFLERERAAFAARLDLPPIKPSEDRPTRILREYRIAVEAGDEQRIAELASEAQQITGGAARVARNIKARLLADADRAMERLLASSDSPVWWLGPVRWRDRYKRRELFHHAAACVATLALGALFAIGLFGWFAK